VPEIPKLLRRLSRFKHLKLLAEKVETYDEFEQTLKMGFDYFQGFFFSQPECIHMQEITSVKVNLLRLLAEVSQKKTTIRRLEEIVSLDVGLSYKLLRYLNSAHFYLIEKVESVARAISFLGANRFRRFVLLVLISEIASDKPEELVRLAVIRSKFCELLSGTGQCAEHSQELFLVGLFSLVDAMLDQSMADLLDELPLHGDVKEALISGSGPYAHVLRAVEFYERGNMKGCGQMLKGYKVSLESLSKMYLESVEYGEHLL
jgi:EAL and modified HD-GYP domain-containing signal transduction protein